MKKTNVQYNKQYYHNRNRNIQPPKINKFAYLHQRNHYQR